MEQREENRKENGTASEMGVRTADLYAIFRDVMKNLWMVILVGISAAFLTYIGAYLRYQPEYRSSTTFVVSAKASSTGAYANLSQTQSMAETFKTVLDSQVLKKAVSYTHLRAHET